MDFRSQIRGSIWLSALLLVVSCSTAYEEIPWQSLKQKWESAEVNSAESWWYCGYHDGFKHFQQRRPGSKLAMLLRQESGLKVLSTDAAVDPAVELRFFDDDAECHNLKLGDLTFPLESE